MSHIDLLSCSLSLTEQSVGETIPLTAIGSCQPPATHTGCEAEGCPEDADKHVADADVDEEHAGRSSQLGEAWEHHEHQKVTEEAQDQDETQKDGHHSVTCPAQLASSDRTCA